MVLATLIAGTILAVWGEQSNIVASHIILRQIDNGLRKRNFTVMVYRVFGYVTNKLGDLRQTFRNTAEMEPAWNVP